MKVESQPTTEEWTKKKRGYRLVVPFFSCKFTKNLKSITMKNLLKIGDTINWKGSWGSDPSKKAKVTGIEVNCVSKDGDEVEVVEWGEVDSESVILSLDNDHWCYGYQVKQIK